jgi:NADH-quinone oxidoreductase subunit F
MGSGGMVVMDEDTCMVDVARYFIEFSHSESCGKCVPCRVGLDQALRLLRKITEGRGELADLKQLEELGGFIRDASLCGLGQTAPNPVLTTLKYFRQEYQEHIRTRHCRAGICDRLFLAPCENSCPLHMRIPGFLQLLKENRLDDAAEMVWLDNPLPGSTGRVCQHPCEDRCRRRTVDEPINMREVHRYISDTLFNEYPAGKIAGLVARNRLPATGKKVAVVGSGPAGLTAAFYLALLGHAVTVYESRGEAGGMLRYSLPEYRLPKAMLMKEVDVIRRLGVTFVFNQKLGADHFIHDLEKEHHAIFLGLGTWREKEAGVPGEEGPGVWAAIDFLAAVLEGETPKMGKQVVVVGGGNAAIDAARTAVRLGARTTVAYRRERADMPAIAEEVNDAEAEGVQLMLYVAPQRIVRDEQGRVTGIELARMKAGDFDRSGRRKPVASGETVVLPCDSVVMAVGEVPDADHLRSAVITVQPDGTVAADWHTYRTDRPHTFAGGDLVTGAANVTRAMATAKRAARAMDRLLMGKDRLAAVLKSFSYDMTVPARPSPGHRNDSPHRPAGERSRHFEEVMLGLPAEAARAEGLRCLRCDVKEHCVPRT